MQQEVWEKAKIKNWLVGALVATLLGLLCSWGAAYAQEKQPAVVVADFGEDGAEAGTGAAVAENLRTLLAGTGRFAVLDRSRINDIVKETKLASSELVSADGAARLGKLATADLVIVGSVVKMGKKYSVSARIVIPESALVIASAGAEAASADGLTAAVRKLAGELEDAASAVSIENDQSETETLFADEFYLRANARWQPIVPGAFYVEEGLLHVGDGNQGGNQCRALLGVPIDADSYIYSGRFRILSSRNDGGAVVIGIKVGTEMTKPSKLRFPDPKKAVADGGGGGTFFVLRANGEMGICAVDGKHRPMPGVRIAGRIDPNLEHSYRMELGGDGVDMYIDDALVGKLRGLPNTGNAIALGTVGRAEAAFSSIQVIKY
jgi:hypothetical protein